MTFPSHLWTHSVCRSLVRPRIQIMAKGLVGLQLKPGLRAHLSSANSQMEDERIYIFGTGTLVGLFAFTLSKRPSSPPITMLLFEPVKSELWDAISKYKKIISQKNSDQQSAFDTQFISHGNNGSLLDQSPIRNLIACATNVDTYGIISMIKHRLDEHSTVLFGQNSLCVMEEVSEQLFPNLKSRPHFLASHLSHHLGYKNMFRSMRGKSSTLSIGFLPRRLSADAQKDESGSTSPAEPSRYLIQQILDTPDLAGKEISTNEIMQIRFRSLILRSMTRSISALFDRPYGRLFVHDKIESLIKLLLNETSRVLEALPELQKDGTLAEELWPETLEDRLVKLTKLNQNSTRTSLRPSVGDPGISKEIDQLNGYIVKKGEQVGIDCVHNRTLVTLVREKRVITEEQIDEFFTLEPSEDPKLTGE